VLVILGVYIYTFPPFYEYLIDNLLFLAMPGALVAHIVLFYMAYLAMTRSHSWIETGRWPSRSRRRS
jgi:hypothetical protein